MIFSQTLFDDLNENQKNLLKWLDDNATKIIDLSIFQVAIKNNVSTSYITKTLKKVGYYGWKDFKGFVTSRMTIPKSSNDYAKYIKETLVRSIMNTITHIDEFDIIDIAESLYKGHSDIFFIGEGFSYYTCLDQARKYNKIGVRSFAVSSADYQLASLRPKDKAIFISASGITESILKSARLLKEKGIYTILITLNKNVNNNFSKIIHGVVYDPENNNEREFPKHSRIVLMTMLDWIYEKVQKNISKK